MFHKCLKETGKPPDVLIQAAAITGEKDWDRLYEVNLVGITNVLINECIIYEQSKVLTLRASFIRSQLSYEKLS